MVVYQTTQARKCLGELVNQVKYKGVIIALGKRGNDDVWMIPKPQIESDTLPISQINAHSPSFGFLESEPDLYSRDDLKKAYV